MNSAKSALDQTAYDRIVQKLLASEYELGAPVAEELDTVEGWQPMNDDAALGDLKAADGAAGSLSSWGQRTPSARSESDPLFQG